MSDTESPMNDSRSTAAPVVVSIITHSGSGHTSEMAKAVARGALSVDGVTVLEHQIRGEDIKDGRWHHEGILADLDASDAIIMGSPTYMGGVSSQLKSFMDATSPRYLERKWTDKLAAAFTVSGLPSGDKASMLMGCAVFAMQHGMLWVGVSESPVSGHGINRLGIFLGAAGQALFEPVTEAPNEEDRLTAECLGRRVASLANRLAGKQNINL